LWQIKTAAGVGIGMIAVAAALVRNKLSITKFFFHHRDHRGHREQQLLLSVISMVKIRIS
jgi:hypothetical protein